MSMKALLLSKLSTEELGELLDDSIVVEPLRREDRMFVKLLRITERHENDFSIAELIEMADNGEI